MKTLRILLSALSALALVAPLSVRADDAVTLTRTNKKGEVTRFKLTINASIAGQDGVVIQKIKEEVKEVKENGDTVISFMVEGGSYSFGGMEMEIPASPAFDQVYDKFGKLLEFKMPEGAAGVMTAEVQHLMAIVNSPILTGKMVKTGDTWETECDNPAVKGKKVVVKGKFLGTEKIDGTDLWKVEQSATADTDDSGSKMSATHTYWINPSDGKAVKSKGEVKDVPTQFGSMTMTVEQALVKDDEKKDK
jgi:hypothetical protein